ncbi:hypothetical protein KPH14_001668 [Odynerus spinipes]|uniref:Borealin n=1 Tax=Odynerus spinipes TaxID=1348599 RepID=A0AAD9RZG5_9HYME|nr:hypothetical protein KPH14_001668 [Odynerus spinipes]
MPRTKQIRKSKQNRESSNESELFLKDFQKKVQLRLMKLDAETNMSIESYITYYNVKLSGIPEKFKQMTIGELMVCNEDQKENSNEVTFNANDQTLPSASATVKVTKTSKRATAVSDDGYVTEGTVTGTRTSRASRTTKAKKAATEVKTRRVTRSNSRSRTSTLSEITQKTLMKNKENGRQSKTDKFKTPAPSNYMKNEFSLITPKIKPNTPLNVLRRPREGEMVLSMQGSPLLISAIVPDKTANVNVPLSNGNIISLLPKDGLRMSNIPDLDPETMQQLETLKGHIEKVISLK